jgi:hypothetical protein
MITKRENRTNPETVPIVDVKTNDENEFSSIVYVTEYSSCLTSTKGCIRMESDTA